MRMAMVKEDLRNQYQNLWRENKNCHRRKLSFFIPCFSIKGKVRNPEVSGCTDLSL